MVDPLSVLGAAVGVTSLIIQLADECYKTYSEAANLPQSHRYLLVRLHIEQQRFLNFALEAGVLNKDGVICSALQVNRSLLLAVLAEIKALFENFAIANGKYENIVEKSDIDWNDHSEPENTLMSLLCITANDHVQSKMAKPTSRRTEAAGRIRGLGKSMTETAQNLRTIVVEPKRLVWAALDKNSFETFISKIGNLNSFLVTLLDSLQLRRLRDSMNTTYLEILQLRNDVVDLTALVKALSPSAEQQLLGADQTSNALSQAVAEEQAIQDKKKTYLKRLAEVKIQLTEMNDLDHTAAVSGLSQLFDTQLPLNDFQFEEDIRESENLQQRTRAIYRGRSAWIEWKDVSAGSALSPDDVQIQYRMGLLTNLLRSVKPDGFRAAPCLGYVKITDAENVIHFGVVFEGPSAAESKITNLRELLGQMPKPSLSARMALCAALARCVHSLHAVNWLHKAIRSDNIVFFSSSSSPHLDAPYVSGFELSRPSIMDEWSEKPGFEPAKDIYRHPYAQSNQTDGSYRKSYDMYSLGVVMTEIALWKPIEEVIGIENLVKAKPSTLRRIQPRLLKKPSKGSAGSCLQRIASACGDSLCGIVECYLDQDTEPMPESDTPLKQQKLTELDLRSRVMEFLRAVGNPHRRKPDKAEQPGRNRRMAYSNTSPLKDTSRRKLYHGGSDTETGVLQIDYENDTKIDYPERNRRAVSPNTIVLEDRPRRSYHYSRNNTGTTSIKDRPVRKYYRNGNDTKTVPVEDRPRQGYRQDGNSNKIDQPGRNRHADDSDSSLTEYQTECRFYQEQKYAEAEPLLRQWIELEEKALGTDDEGTLKRKHRLARLLFRLERYKESEQLLSEILRLREKELGVDHEDTLESKFWLARTLYEQDRNFESTRLLHELLQQEQLVFGMDHEKTKGTKRLLHRAIVAKGRLIPPRASASQELLYQTVHAQPQPTIPAYVFPSEKPLHEAVHEKEPAIPMEASASKESSTKVVLAKKLAGPTNIFAWERGFSKEISTLSTNEPAIPTGAAANERFSLEAVSAKEPAVLADAIESIGFPHNVLLEQAPTASTDALSSKEIDREEIPVQAQVPSTSSLEDAVQSRLSDFFADNNQRQTAYTDSEIQRVSILLSQLNLQWSKVPRTYIVLRTIGCLDLLNTFVDLGYSDHWFPITERSLPLSLRPSKRSQFVAAQNLIMTKSMGLEKGQHCFFRKGEPLPLEMKEMLGTGSHRKEDRQVNRVLSLISFQEYALKQVKRATGFGGRGTESVKQFITEIQILKRIKHEHVVEFIGSYTNPEVIGLLMLPVADMDLSTYLERVDMAKHRELRTFFGCLARALEFLHDQKIRHKDIKPSNILVHGGKVLYTDFGLALDFTDKDGSTTGSMVNGRTAKYCAPEVADCESRNTSSDIWSLGVVFLEMTAVLKGRTVGSVYDFLKLHGTGQGYVRTNPTGTASLIAELKATGSPIDNAALVWVQDMIMVQQQLRPTAAWLIGDIINVGQERDGNGAFCGICCASHDDLFSDWDELEIADIS
ncbi:hypothetical protein yc1106_07026 [Curvularia clavata]|uniref:Protein kinase domain-containing protein n=1 Tax=Curvularia clavata TaxID=95742 RepID=A0A9Q8ZAU8_CURCL|nr:hypothetical protein yc1106_07026 [Curvularia clavata]